MGRRSQGILFRRLPRLTSSPLELGGIRWPILAACTLAWAITWLAITSGVRKGIERACKILIPLLFLLVLVLIVRVVNLPGAMDGLNYLFNPDFSKLADFSVWADAYGQIFFSLSIGFSIMLAYSSYLPEDSDINNNAAITVFINCGFSMLAGVMIFSVLGNMANATGQAVSDVAGSGVGLAFITIPAAINTMPAPVFVGTLFFLCLTMAGVSSHISIVEAVCASFIDKFGMSRKRTATLVCGFGFAMTLIFTTGGGLLILDIVDHFINNMCILGLALAEIILMSYIVGLDDLNAHVNAISDFKVGTAWKLCLKLVTVAVLGYTFIMNVITDLGTPYGGYSMQDLVTLGWSLLPVAFVLSMVLNKRQPAYGFVRND